MVTAQRMDSSVSSHAISDFLDQKRTNTARVCLDMCMDKNYTNACVRVLGAAVAMRPPNFSQCSQVVTVFR